MRKGAKRYDWTTQEDRYLLEHAGRIPKRDICLHLRRSSKSVERRAAWHRSQGRAIELRCFKPRTEFCPGCGCRRTTLGKFGICEVCRRRDQLVQIESRIAALFPLLSQQDRDRYEETEAETESRRDPRPKSPRIPAGTSYYREQRIREAHDMEVERFEIANLKREIKATQKRKERIEKKVKTNGCLHIPPDRSHK